jgi:uncharacterized membrane protein YdjX (TVP38/TMEM64 family)
VIVSRTAKLVLACIGVAFVVAAIAWLPIGAWLREVVEWTRNLGLPGVLVFSAVFIVVALAVLPTMELYIAAGFLYGTWWGALLVTVLGVVVELLTLWLVHTRFRERIERRVQSHPRLAALDRGISQHPFWIVQLLRISPLVPFAPLNYALALTKIPLWERIIANVIGMGLCALPQTYIGSLLSGAGQLGDADAPPVWKHIALLVGLTTAIGACVITAWATKRALTDQEHT